jgi:hypothetical protein
MSPANPSQPNYPLGGAPYAPPGAAPVIGPALVSEDRVPAHHGLTALLSNMVRVGRWELPRRMRVAAFMGQVRLDLTQVVLAPGVSTIEVMCIMGEVKIVVPNSLRVEVSGNPILGEFQFKGAGVAPAAPNAPLVRIVGSAIAGTVTVRLVDPAAPRWWEAWLGRRRDRLQPPAGA